MSEHPRGSDAHLQIKGLRAFLSGQSAEAACLRLCQSRGLSLCATRWRGQAGEIDLIMLDGPELVFCEVKKARSHDAAMASLSRAQMQRIVATALEYIGTKPEFALSPVRFDLATVDAQGEVQILANAFGEF